MTEFMRNRIIELIEKDIREDNRGMAEYRNPIIVQYGASKNSAEGSARVTIGKTEVIAGVKLEVGEPYPDTPDEGALMVGVELLPLSNPEFESGPPGIDAIEIARVVDRGIRESNCVDMKKLCIKKGEKVWMILLDIYPLNDDGNLFDAAALAATAALKDTKFPDYNEKSNEIDYKKRTSKSLPIKSMPVSVTVLRVKSKFIIDPTINEWKAMDARLSVTFTEDGKICAMQKGCDKSLSVQDIEKMIELAHEKSKELRNHLI